MFLEVLIFVHVLIKKIMIIISYFFSFQKHVLDQFWWISRRSCRCHTRSRKYLDLFLWFEIGVWHFSSPWFKVLIWVILPGINLDYSTLLSERTENRFTPAQNKFLTTIISQRFIELVSFSIHFLYFWISYIRLKLLKVILVTTYLRCCYF